MAYGLRPPRAAYVSHRREDPFSGYRIVLHGTVYDPTALPRWRLEIVAAGCLVQGQPKQATFCANLIRNLADPWSSPRQVLTPYIVEKLFERAGGELT